VPLAGLALALALLALACGPSTPVPPVLLTPVPPPRATQRPLPTPTLIPLPVGISPALPLTPSPTGPTAVPRGVAGFVASGTLTIPAAEQPPAVEATLRGLVGFGIHLYHLAAGPKANPTGGDMVEMVRRMSDLMAQVERQMPLMTETERQQALLIESTAVFWMDAVVDTYTEVHLLSTPLVPVGTPQPVPGRPKLLINPVKPLPGLGAPPTTYESLRLDIDAIRAHVSGLARDRPNADDIKVVLGSMEATLVAERQLAPLLATQQLQSLAVGMVAAMDLLVDAMRAFVEPVE